MSRELLTVIIPCYNEEGNLEHTVDDVLSVAPDIPADPAERQIDHREQGDDRI